MDPRDMNTWMYQAWLEDQAAGQDARMREAVEAHKQGR